MINLIKIFIPILFLLTPFLLKAEDDLTFMEKAKERKYIGGADESDLKLQQKTLDDKNSIVKKNNEISEGF